MLGSEGAEGAPRGRRGSGEEMDVDMDMSDASGSDRSDDEVSERTEAIRTRSDGSDMGEGETLKESRTPDCLSICPPPSGGPFAQAHRECLSLLKRCGTGARESPSLGVSVHNCRSLVCERTTVGQQQLS